MPGQVITGVVRDQSGKPLAEATIAFASGPAPLPDIATLTDQNGRFQLSAPTPGSYNVVCTLPDGRGETRTVEVGDATETSITFEFRVDPL